MGVPRGWHGGCTRGGLENLAMTGITCSTRCGLTLGFVAVLIGVGCSGDGKGGPTPALVEGASEFSSAPPNGQGTRDAGDLASGSGGSSSAPSAGPGAREQGDSAKPRTVEET